MVELFRPPESELADELESCLRDMVAAYRSVEIESPDSLEFADELPVIRHGDDVVVGEGALLEYVDELQDLLREWDRFGSDACYIEEDGTIC